MATLLTIFFCWLIAYLIGSIPFGLILTKSFTKTDIRSIGSGNIGATNVLRSGRKDLAFLTLLLDFFKGYSALFILYFLLLASHFGHLAKDIFELNPFLSGTSILSLPNVLLLFLPLFPILGHCFPVWLKFKGGKGVATTFGVLLAAVPWAGFLAAVTWGIVAGFTRYSSLAALSAVALTPLFTFIYYGAAPAIITILIALLVIWRHKENIQRLSTGTESKIGSKKKDKNEPAADTE